MAPGLLWVFGDVSFLAGLSPEPLNTPKTSSWGDSSPWRHTQKLCECTIRVLGWLLYPHRVSPWTAWFIASIISIKMLGFFLFFHAFQAFVALYSSIWSTLLHCLQKEKYWIQGNISTQKTPSWIVSDADIILPLCFLCKPILEEHYKFPPSEETAAWFLGLKPKVFVDVCSFTTAFYIIVPSTHLHHHTFQGRGKQIKIKNASKKQTPWDLIQAGTLQQTACRAAESRACVM